jgi:hypothetical protein
MLTWAYAYLASKMSQKGATQIIGSRDLGCMMLLVVPADVAIVWIVCGAIVNLIVRH